MINMCTEVNMNMNVNEVIEGLNSILNDYGIQGEQEEQDVISSALRILEMLKIRKVKYIQVRKSTLKGFCPYCSMEITSTKGGLHTTKYCRYCGQAVTWNEDSL